MSGYAPMLLATAAATMSLLTSAPAMAGSAAEVVQVVVGHADLDLAQERDVAKLDRRLRLAARDICGINANDTARRLAAQACQSRTLASTAEPRRAAIAAATNGAPRSAMADPIVMRAR